MISPSPQPSLKESDIAERDSYLVIRGKRLELDTLVNKDFFKSDQVDLIRNSFREAKPFAHVALDQLFNPDLLDLLLEEFELSGSAAWRTVESKNELTRRLYPNSKVGPATQLYYNLVSSGWFVDWLSAATGVKNIIPDPHFYSGGLHQARQGGHFDVHIDFNQHHTMMLKNELVFITYLNKNWHKEYNGALELWDIDDTMDPVEIWPEFGRTVIFQQGVHSLHGHPKALTTPPDVTRKSILSYYYINQNAEKNLKYRHWTLFFQRSQFKRWFEIKYTINYRLLPSLGLQGLLSTWQKFKKKLIP